MTIKHAHQTTVPHNDAYDISSNEWNAGHTIDEMKTLSAAAVLNGAVVSLGFGEVAGLLVVTDKTTPQGALFRVIHQTPYVVSSDDGFTTVKDTAASINVYFESGEFRCQNNSGGTIDLDFLLLGVAL